MVRRPRMTPGLAMFLMVALAFAIRLIFVLNHAGYWGVDGGAYLLSQHYWLTGEQIQDFTRPPLAPGYLLVPFTWAFGPDMGLKAFALFCSLPMLIPFWLLAREALSPWPAVLATSGVLFGWMLSEMFVAGGLPMLGFCALLFAFWGIWKLMAGFRWRYALAVILGIGIIPYLNQTTTGIALIVLPVFTVGSMVATRHWGGLRYVALAAAFGGAVALPASYYYASVMPGSGMLRYPGPLVTTYSGNDAAWSIAFMLGPLMGYAAWKGQGMVRAMAITLLACLPISVLYSFDESLQNIFYRIRYLQEALSFIVLVALAARAYRATAQRYRWWLYPAVAASAVVLLLGSLYTLHTSTKIERMVLPEAVEAIEWIKPQLNGKTVVTNSYSMSLYVAALTEHASPWLQVYDPPPAYKDQHEKVACMLGWYPWYPGCDPQTSIAELDAGYVLINRLWPAYGDEVGRNTPGLHPMYNTITSMSDPFGWPDDYGLIWGAPADCWELADSLPWLTPVWEKGLVKVWKVVN